MKLSGSMVSVIVAVVVLIGALGAGLGIKEVRVRKAKAEAEALSKLQKAQARQARTGPLSRSTTGVDRQTAEAQDRQRTGQDREQARARWENASPEEQQRMRQEMGDRFRSRGPGGGRFGANMSPEEREKMRAEMEGMRQRWESMSEEEKAQATAQMRQRFEGASQGGGPSGDRGDAGGGAEPAMREAPPPAEGQDSNDVAVTERRSEQ
jgi:hypothetical protein